MASSTWMRVLTTSMGVAAYGTCEWVKLALSEGVDSGGQSNIETDIRHV